MPRTIPERHCNLTLTRDQWAVLKSMLDRLRIFHPSVGGMPGSVIGAIDAALQADPEATSVSMDRECEKWATVINAIHGDACKRGGECGKVLDAMTRQVSAAMYTET